MITGSHSLPLPKNDPELLKLVPVRVLKPFCIGGQIQAVGAIVKIERHLAVGLVSLKKAELV